MEQEIFETIPEKNIEIEEESLENEVLEEDGGEEKSELDLLKEELESLRGEIARRDALDESNKRMLRECEEFKEYFPNSELSSVPDEVWESVKGGVPLAAAYALYARREELHRSRIDEFNQRNKLMSAGSVKRGGEERFYSPSEVRSMTREQVKSNYTDIIESMRHWN